MPESTAVGANVGLPVTATDPDPEDIVSYELIAAPAANSLDVGFFEIDKESAQITVAQGLDADEQRDTNGDGSINATDGAAGEYMVIVRATDPSGLADNITVTITAENVNEAPTITGRAELMVMEAPGYVALVDPVNTYEPVEEDHVTDSIATWHLDGDDGAAFDLSGLFEPRYLNFKKAPDFENPTDANRDNVYEVTIVATDTDPFGTGAGIGKTNVWVIVENVEEGGKVVFTEGETAYLDEKLVAEVQDPDDHGGDLGQPYEGVHIVTWQWSSSQDDDDPTDAPFVNIVGETTNEYTPDDDDRGYYLRVTATYTDPHNPEDLSATALDDRVIDPDSNSRLIEVSTTTEHAVRVAPGPESAPSFPRWVGHSDEVFG